MTPKTHRCPHCNAPEPPASDEWSLGAKIAVGLVLPLLVALFIGTFSRVIRTATKDAREPSIAGNHGSASITSTTPRTTTVTARIPRTLSASEIAEIARVRALEITRNARLRADTRAILARAYAETPDPAKAKAEDDAWDRALAVAMAHDRKLGLHIGARKSRANFEITRRIFHTPGWNDNVGILSLIYRLGEMHPNQYPDLETNQNP